MKVTDYIVEFLLSKEITDVFGYPGGVICHFIDSLSKFDGIEGHINYHEQASSFAACGYAQESGRPGVAYATSGPGATNLITGIANAYYDSIPTIFFTGQVDTYGLKGDLRIRQRGFQETDTVGIVRPITKYAVRVDDPKKIRYELEKAYYYALEGNPGPVLLDLPADVQRADIDIKDLEAYVPQQREYKINDCVDSLINSLMSSKRPCLLLGNGIKQSGLTNRITEIIDLIDIPTVFSMPAIDILPSSHRDNYGFIGANGHRAANFVLGKCDLIISMGSRLDLKQVGNDRRQFAQQAHIIRVDIDECNLEYKVHDDEIQYIVDLKLLLGSLRDKLINSEFDFSTWRATCDKVSSKVIGVDVQEYTDLIRQFSDSLPGGITITADVGQSEVWVTQYYTFKFGDSLHISAGHGAMGYSLPAAIGAYYANKRPVICFNGDGGIQMNMQELQFISREKIPVTVVVLNNHSLGMIRGFQEANFEKNYQQTTFESGYSCPDFEKIAYGYGLSYSKILSVEELKTFKLNTFEPNIVEIVLPDTTELQPNFGRNGYIQDQRPYIDRNLYEEIMSL